MIPKIVWPHTFTKGNPFGGADGFRPIRLTFHSRSFAGIPIDEKVALDDLIGLSKLDDIDAMSFNGEVWPKIFIESEKADEQDVGLQIINSDGIPISFHSGVDKSWLTRDHVEYLLGSYNSDEEEKLQFARQDLLEAKSHGALRRDIFVTASNFLLKNRDKLNELNIYTPREALKIVGLYLRTKGEFEWISHIKGKSRFITSRLTFYQFLCRGLIPNSWRYTSALGLHSDHEKLSPLGWSVLNRCMRALQARDEIGRLFYIPATPSSEDQIAYHFDYLTLLLTAALDVQALIINRIYSLGLKDEQCGLRRGAFKTKLSKNHATSNLNILLTSKRNFINILFDLRNKIHAVSLQIDIHVPETYPDEFLEKIYNYDPNNHWGVQKEKVTVVENGSSPVPSFRYSIDRYSLTYYLVDETFRLIGLLMDETRIEDYLPSADLPKIKSDPPADAMPYIQTYLLLA